MAGTPNNPVLPPAAVKRIGRAVDATFDRLKARVLGPKMVPKRIYVQTNHHLSLPGIFEAAAREEQVKPNEALLNQLLNVASTYVDSQRERTKANVIQAVQAFLQDAARTNIQTDLSTVLEGRLQEVWSKTASEVRKIVDTETQHTKNVGLLDGILRVNMSQGIEDAVVYFVVVRDGDLCDECKRLHLLPDGKTPRVWKMSEVGSGYHKKGDKEPKTGGLHPHCRCQIVTLLPSYGFDKAGFVSFIARGHDEWAKQRG